MSRMTSLPTRILRARLGSLAGPIEVHTAAWTRPAVRRHSKWIERCQAVPPASSVRTMERIVLRVRLVSGDSMDVTYEHNDGGGEAATVDHVIATLSEPSGMLR